MSGSASVRTTQVVVQALEEAPATARVTQAVVAALENRPADMRATQVVILALVDDGGWRGRTFLVA